jgi:transcriptional regulator with XRE-family HTH domain
MTETTVAPPGLKWTPRANTLWFMTDEQRRPRPAAQYGPTAATVAENVKRLRDRRGLSIYQLSALLRDAGRPITPAAVGKIERQQRQVNVDDLAALAIIFGVSPSALLLPLTPRSDAPVEVTGGGTVSAGDAWSWADGERPLKVTEGNERKEMMEHQLYGRPQWLYERSPERLKAKREFFEQLAEWGAVDLDVVKRTDPAPWDED